MNDDMVVDERRQRKDGVVVDKQRRHSVQTVVGDVKANKREASNNSQVPWTMCDYKA